jgi:ABC-2 type transport system permease protein
MDLKQKGVVVTELQTTNDEEFSMKEFFPYALVQYNGKIMPIMLLENMTGQATPEEKISYAETMLEYKFANALNQMGRPDVGHIAYLVGNGEPLDATTYDMLRSLTARYWLDTVDLAHISQVSLAYDAIIIVQPKIPFTQGEKLRLDQYIMRGGHMLLSLNMLNASLDSLANASQFMAMDLSVDLDNLLYKYGIRVNSDLVEDMQNMRLGRTMNDGKPQLYDWIYFPRLNPTSEHPIVRNMDFIRAGFTNSIDTIASPAIKKTILLQSSKYSRKTQAPARVALSMMNYKMQEQQFNKSYLPVAVLLEGKFRSAYENKLAPEYLRFLNDSLKQPYKPACDTENKIIVTSIGDVFLNRYNTKDGVMPMSYYTWTGEYFANKDFLLNCVEYLTDHSGVLEARSKEVKLRLLDTGRAKDEKPRWQFVNVVIPIGMVLIFASGYFFFRRRRYETKSNEVNPASK